MTKEKMTINDVLDSLGFNEKEKKTFVECIQIVKNEQQEENDLAELEIQKKIEEVAKK